MNIVEKALLIIIILAMSFVMIPTIFGIVMASLPADIMFIIIFAIILGVIGIPILIIKHKED